MPNTFCRYGGVILLGLLFFVVGCDNSSELETAQRRAEKAEQTISSLRQVRDDLIEKKKDLELQVLQLQQPNVVEAVDPPVPVEPQVVSDDPGRHKIEALEQQLRLARTEIQERDKDIQELQTLVEALTQTVNQLQGGDLEEVILEADDVQDTNGLKTP